MFAYMILVSVPIAYFALLQGIKSTYRLNEIPYRSSVLKLFFLIYFLLLACRGRYVGVDTVNYLAKFEYADEWSWGRWISGSSFEIGFLILTKLVAAITSNEQIYLAVIAAVSVVPIAWFYARESEGPILTMALFLILPLFGMPFSGFRQAIAIALAAPAYCCVRQRNKAGFVWAVVFAMLFHRSAVILFLMYPIYYMRLTRQKLIWIIPLVLAVYLFSDSIFAVLLRVITVFYKDQEWQVQATGAYAMLLLFALLLLFCYVFVNEEEADQETIGLRNFLVMSVLLQCFASANTLAMRMNYYYLLFLPVLLPRVIHRAKGKNALTCQIANAAFCAYFLYYFVDQVYSGDSSFRIFPYTPFWAA